MKTRYSKFWNIKWKKKNSCNCRGNGFCYEFCTHYVYLHGLLLVLSIEGKEGVKKLNFLVLWKNLFSAWGLLNWKSNLLHFKKWGKMGVIFLYLNIFSRALLIMISSQRRIELILTCLF